MSCELVTVSTSSELPSILFKSSLSYNATLDLLVTFKVFGIQKRSTSFSKVETISSNNAGIVSLDKSSLLTEKDAQNFDDFPKNGIFDSIIWALRNSKDSPLSLFNLALFL